MKLTIEIDLDRYGPTVNPDGKVVFKHRTALHNALIFAVDEIGAYRSDPTIPLPPKGEFEDFAKHYTAEDIDMHNCSYNDTEQTKVGAWLISGAIPE